MLYAAGESDGADLFSPRVNMELENRLVELRLLYAFST
jgi:hypothetical protein